MIKLACPDFTWPLMPHTTALDLIRSLEFEAVVLGLFGNRSHIRPEVVRKDVPKWAGILGERTARAGLEVADLFVQAWTDVEKRWRSTILTQSSELMATRSFSTCSSWRAG